MWCIVVINLTEKAETSQNTSSSVALTMMKQELPQYIQRMFEAAGYATLQTITDMDVTSESNDIDRILNYIKQTFPKDARLVVTNVNFTIAINVSL